MDERAKVYRNVERRQEWLGLEHFDWLAIGALGWLLMLLSKHALGWDLLILVSTWAALRLLKRGKPPGYTGALIRFYLARKPFFSAQARDLEVLRHPFGTRK
jgi:hypothetical protein